MIVVADVANLVNDKILIGIAVGVLVVISGWYILLADASESNNMMGSGMGSMMKSDNMMNMMSEIPQDVIVKVTSGQVVKAGKDAKITLLVLDKETKKPVSNAHIIVGIEKGASMSTMNMVSGMFEAKEIGSGKYDVSFRLDEKGHYTVHIHVILDGKSMHSMMQNHLDIGIIVK